ncbi:MAG: GNAT family N-acetyltransferase [Bacteroidales bacterium]|jgi:ribosomal protein S18 acetylase RimI-like enzyme|nr:GNAT family N-acetyltransferase [Bacteroidales bacterium]
MNNDFEIRQYREGDYEHIAGFWELTGMGSPERGDSKRVVEDTIRLGGSLLVMEEKISGRIAGTSWMTFDGRRILLHHFGIRPELQGNGLSKFLLEESLKFVKKKGYQVKLEVHNNNIKAINLYKKYGFRHLGEYNVYIIRDISRL